MATIVHKQHKKKPEPFNPIKLKNTIYAACLNVREPEKSARQTAEQVTHEIKQWLQTKPEVTSLDLKDKVVHLLGQYHPEAAYIYEQYNVTI